MHLLSLCARTAGFFLMSPLFCRLKIPIFIRILLCLGCLLILAPAVYAKSTELQPFVYFQLAQDLLFGYLIGLFVSLWIEAAACAGEILSPMAGFSTTSIINQAPQSDSSITHLFSMLAFLLLFVLDLHHPLLRLLYDNPFTWPQKTIPQTLIQAVTFLFQTALDYALFPFLTLFLLGIVYALLARFIPDFPMFWLGLPLQQMIGLGMLILSAPFVTEILKKSFYELLCLIHYSLDKL